MNTDDCIEQFNNYAKSVERGGNIERAFGLKFAAKFLKEFHDDFIKHPNKANSVCACDQCQHYMDITMINKLAAMTANRNALREEIQGLHLMINNLRGQLGLKSLFNDLPPNKVDSVCTCEEPTYKGIWTCVKCGGKMPEEI